MKTRSAITTHILDTSRGVPAAGVEVILEIQSAEGWKKAAQGKTNSDGRIDDWLPLDAKASAGIYRLTFNTGAYFKGESLYPEICVQFKLDSPEKHYHIPLLLSPYGYSTYRGT